MTPPRLRVASDVGGTFTDNLAYDEAARHVTVAKVPTTPENRALGTVRGLRQALAAQRIAALCLDLDHVRAHVGQHHRAKRSGEDARQIDNPDSR